MSAITTCPLCGDCYQESSEENANRPDRMCSRCWTAQAKVIEAAFAALDSIGRFEIYTLLAEARRLRAELGEGK